MTQGTQIQTSFVSGELSPSMFGQVHNPKYQSGASTFRNGFVNFQGGFSSRPGSVHIGMCRQNAPNIGTANNTKAPPRDIPFQVSITQSYVLEFGDFYLRIKDQGAYITEAPITVTSVSVAGLFTTSGAHGYSSGDWIYDSGNTGFDSLTWIVSTTPLSTTFTVTDLFGNIITSATASTGGSVARIYNVAAPYAASDLPYLKFTQSADVMSLTCYNQVTLTEYPPYDLTRISAVDWAFAQTNYAASIEPPLNVISTAQSSITLDTWYSYVVTAINAITGDQSVASTQTQVHNNDISVNAGTNTITWNPVIGASNYNIYSAAPYYSTSSSPLLQIGVPFGFLGSATGTSFIDSNIIPNFTITPPLHNNPFARGQITAVTPTAGGSGLSQTTVNYTITTSTGSGFFGTPIISSSGNLIGFLIEDSGEGYALADTITIVTGGVAAIGTYTGIYSGTGTTNPINGQTIFLNGVKWTFETSATNPSQTQIQSTLHQTFIQLASDLAASGNPLITAANYNVTGTATLNITYAEIGTVGNAYTLGTGSYNGIISASALSGGSNGTASSATASLTIGSESGTYPSVVAYFQERRTYANTINNPDTYYMSQPGSFTNMDASIPSVDSDAIIGTPSSQNVNGIQFMVPMPGGLVIFTGGGEWQLNGGNTVAITPSDQDVQPQSRYGCSSTVPPIPINFHILFVRENNGVVYDLVYNFWANIYIGNDLTIYSSHLFNDFGYTISQWAYAEKPYKIIWAVRSDGALLSLTYSAEQEEQGWARHDTNGLYVGVCSIEEPPVDAVYVIVQRYVNGVWVYYSERFDNRIWTNPENCFCVDDGLSYPMTFPAVTLNASATNSTNNITSTVVIQGGNFPNLDAVAVAQDSTGAGAGATFTISYSGTAISTVTPSASGADYTSGATEIVIFSPTGGSGAIIQPIITNYVTFTASSGVFNSGQVGDIIRMGNGKAIIVTYTSSTVVVGNIIAPITATLSNDPNNTPLPAIANTWSISTPITIITGLNHLQGLTVTGLADGGVITPQVVGAVTGGIGITLQQSASAINVGLPFTAQLQTLPIEIQGQSTVQSKRKGIPSVGVRVHNTRGISIGINQPDASMQPGNANVPWSNMSEIKEMNQSVVMGQPIPLANGTFFKNVIGGGWSVLGQIACQQSYPLPMNVDSLVSWFNLGDSGEGMQQ